MTADLSALIARLEAAEAGSRELGHEVLLALGWRRSVVGHFYGPLYQWSSPDFSPHLISGDEDKLPNPVLSLDAALALAETALPEWPCWGVATDIPGRIGAVLAKSNRDEGVTGYAATPALALVIATLRAKLDGYAAEGEVNKNPKAQEG
ncbi:hypothetical protein HMPREF0185_00178 [Brevundimonas diminuta 470-4]|nr:hypothetical protein HMPREF0185_00178 [Brevundimonas diminuta 470-4]